MVSLRHRARRVAIQSLYEAETVGHPVEIVLERLLREKALSGEASVFANELVLGVLQNKEKIDALIRENAPIWPVEQLSTIDRNILRLAIFEMMINNKVPMKVAITEAVELAKAFGSDSSPRFVNGVLGSLTAQHTTVVS